MTVRSFHTRLSEVDWARMERYLEAHPHPRPAKYEFIAVAIGRLLDDLEADKRSTDPLGFWLLTRPIADVRDDPEVLGGKVT